ncbi:ATP-binding protein [Streptomyces populi]|uniref:ATP-binding protein n=1 Tax=Streptomyces populi TaxID=2058924 RepID=UPI0013A6B1DB|nr:ATP-binding protein [Streptomyces populi]
MLRPTDTATALLPLPAERSPFRWTARLAANDGAAANARLRARPRLTMSKWPGNIDAAARVASHLADNAVRHGKPFPDDKIVLRLLAHGETDELLVEVDDAFPDFPRFDQVANQSPESRLSPPGLWWPAHYRGTISWDLKRDGDGMVIGKTVQALLPATWDGSA